MLDLITPLAIGGVLLIVASYFVFQGKIFYSTLFYILADFCWILNACVNGDTMGVISVCIGVAANLAMMYKMNNGTFVKDINKEK